MTEEPERRSVKGWVHHLTAPDALLTLEELQTLAIIEMRDNVMKGREATEHVEGMIGSLDGWLAERDPGYRAVAARRSRPAEMLPGGQP